MAKALAPDSGAELRKTKELMGEISENKSQLFQSYWQRARYKDQPPQGPLWWDNDDFGNWIRSTEGAEFVIVKEAEPSSMEKGMLRNFIAQSLLRWYKWRDVKMEERLFKYNPVIHALLPDRELPAPIKERSDYLLQSMLIDLRQRLPHRDGNLFDEYINAGGRAQTFSELFKDLVKYHLQNHKEDVYVVLYGLASYPDQEHAKEVCKMLWELKCEARQQRAEDKADPKPSTTVRILLAGPGVESMLESIPAGQSEIPRIVLELSPSTPAAEGSAAN